MAGDKVAAAHLARHPATRAGLFLVAMPVLLLWLGARTDIDLMLADAMFDPATRSFPWRHAWITERFGHGLLKYLLVFLGAAVALACAWEWRLARRRWPQWWRQRMQVLALSAVLVPLAISLLKQASSSHCPWDLERYGGNQPYLRLLDAVPLGIPAGHCLPAGHASTALWLVALTVFWLPRRPRSAAAVAFATLALGFALGWMQQLRGAHFLSHTLWSMWLAGAIVAALYAGIVRRN